MRSVYRQLRNAFFYSCSGLRDVFARELAFRIELVVFIFLLPVAVSLPVLALERVFLVVSLLLILLVEVLNSAIERVVDLCSPQKHPLAKAAKDLGSAAVFIATIIAIIIWGSVLYNLFL